MEYALTALIVMAFYHFIYESIIAPSARLKLRFKLLALRDQLRSLKIASAHEFEDRHFSHLQDSFNRLIALLSRFDLATVHRVESEIERNPELKARAASRAAILDDCKVAEAQQIRVASLEIATQALAINSGGGWLVYGVPFLLLLFAHLAVYLGLSSWFSVLARRVKSVISIPEADIEKVVPLLR
jgi:hypothetical protein